MTTSPTTPRLSEPERRLLRRRFEATRRELHAALDERQRLQDELELAQQQEGAAIAVNQQAGAEAAATMWQPGAEAARAQADRTDAALREAISRRVRAEQAVSPSPLSDDVRLGRITPVGPRIASLRGALAALAAALGESLAPGESAPPPPAPPALLPYTLGPTPAELIAAHTPVPAPPLCYPAVSAPPGESTLRARIRAGLERLGGAGTDG